MPQAAEKPNPYDNTDTRLWKLDRRVHKLEMSLDNIESRLDRVEDGIRDLRSLITNWSLFFGCIIIFSNAIIGALL